MKQFQILLTLLITKTNLQSITIDPNLLSKLQNPEALPNQLKNPIITELGSLYNKISNKNEIINQKIKPQAFSKNKFKKYAPLRCRIRSGRKTTNWAWNGNHAFVNGSGSREIYYYVPFTPFFPYGTPRVEIGLFGLDTYKNSNLRVNSSVAWKSRYGFVLKIVTWADSKVYFAGFSYMAYHGCD